jgi:hypothetical protein
MTTIAKPEHEAAYQDIVELISRHADKLTQVELLAIAGNFVGRLIAMQDMRTMTPALAMAIVTENIAIGNAQILEHLLRSKGNA